MSEREPLTCSVLVTTYNGERFIEEQLASILSQTKPVDQVLICDDGSTDSTASLVQGFIQDHALSHWSLVENESNLGPATNVLTHLKDLSGDLVFLADQDDVWEPGKVATMADHMSTHPATTLLVSATHVIDQKRRRDDGALARRSGVATSRIGTGSSAPPEAIGFEDFIGSSTVPLHAMCVRGDVARTIGGSGTFPDLSRSLGADWYIGIWSTIIGSAQLLHEPLMARRIHDANVSLGRLRKTTVLAASPERRRSVLRESRDAHQFLRGQATLGPALDSDRASALDQMTRFLQMRVSFAEQPSLRRALGLLSQFAFYRRSMGTHRRGARMWVSDVMYAYDINWTLTRGGGQ